MTLTTKYFTCMQCGGHELDDIGGDRFKCRSCGTVYEQDRIDDYEKIFERFDEALRKQRSEDLAKLARRRYEETHIKKYVSNVEVERVCNKILDLNPDDFYSQFYIATCKEDCSLADFLYDLDVKKHYYDVEQMLGYLIRGLQARWINPVSTLIEKAYKNSDIGKYNTYRTKFEEMADKVDNGMFEPTLPRDIFVAYSSKDMAKVNELLRVLEEENGLSCFVAARNLRHGAGAVEKYREAIETAIRNCQTVVFVSSTSSRNSKCEAISELNYIKTNMPEMGRIELLAENYRGIAIERIFTSFFDGLEYCTSPQEVAERYIDKYMFASQNKQAEEEAARKAEAERIAKQQAEAEAKLKAEAEKIAKQQAAAEAKLKAEAEKIAKQKAEIEESKRKAEAERLAKQKAAAEAEERRKFEEETRRRLEAEFAAKLQAQAQPEHKAEAEAEVKPETETKPTAKRSRKADKVNEVKIEPLTEQKDEETKPTAKRKSTGTKNKKQSAQPEFSPEQKADMINVLKAQTGRGDTAAKSAKPKTETVQKSTPKPVREPMPKPEWKPVADTMPKPVWEPVSKQAKEKLYDVKLVSYGNKKLACIALVREVTGAGLSDAMNIVTGSGKILSGVSEAEAKSVSKKFSDNGFNVSVVASEN